MHNITVVILFERVVDVASLLIKGRQKLEGKVKIQGAKNSALPILIATILASTKCVLHNCPKLSDVYTTISILEYLGVKTKWQGDTLIIDSSGIDKHDIPIRFMNKMSSSIVFLGALAAKMGQVQAFLPGGCELGQRPIDLHLKYLKKMGLAISEFDNSLNCSVKNYICGTTIPLEFPSVGATENLILAAVLANGVTIIKNAAQEPEIFDLCDFLVKCGAKIKSLPDGSIYIEGVNKLHGCEHTIIPDRIVATTFMVAASVTKGDLLLENVNVNHLKAVINVFRESGQCVKCMNDKIRVSGIGQIFPLKSVVTEPYPGFPTDAQAIIMTMCTLAKGRSTFIENIFTGRYKHVSELVKLGAKIKVKDRTAIVDGVNELFGNKVYAKDLRGGAALVLAGLAANGKTQVFNVNHIDRGYENIENSFNLIGADIKRI